MISKAQKQANAERAILSRITNFRVKGELIDHPHVNYWDVPDFLVRYFNEYHESLLEKKLPDLAYQTEQEVLNIVLFIFGIDCPHTNRKPTFSEAPCGWFGHAWTFPAVLYWTCSDCGRTF